MRKTIVTVIAVFCSLLAAFSVQAQQSTRKPVDIGAVATEAMIMKTDTEDRYQLALWYPYGLYVESSMMKSKESRADVEKATAYLKPYITIAVQCSIQKEDGDSVYASESKVLARAVLKDADGSEILPVVKPPAMVSATVAAIKAIISAEGDEGSKNMHVLVFPNKGKNGKPLVDENAKSKLTMVLKADGSYKETEFVWNTPFDSLKSVPPCPNCKEHVSAKWSFCPWCGAKLP